LGSTAPHSSSSFRSGATSWVADRQEECGNRLGGKVGRCCTIRGAAIPTRGGDAAEPLLDLYYSYCILPIVVGGWQLGNSQRNVSWCAAAFFSFCLDPLFIAIFRTASVSALSSSCGRHGRKRPQLVVETSNLTATSAFPALAILRP
jgi:hypothetical protein